jgi:hypothetical protein
MLRAELAKYVQRNLECTFAPSDPDHARQVHAVLELLREQVTPATVAAGQPMPAHVKRLRAWQRLRASLAGPVRGAEKLYHHCPLGCHASSAAVTKDIVDDLTETFLNHPPVVPAWNKWTKLYPPLAWFTVFSGLGGILPGILIGLSSLVDEVEFENGDPDAAAVGMMDDQNAFKCQEQARFKKTSKWLSASCTPSKLMCTTLSFRFVMSLLGKLFESSSRFEPSAADSMLPLLLRSSPAHAAISQYLLVLGHWSHVFGCVFVCLFACWHVCLFVCLWVCVFVCLCVCVCLFVCLYVCLIVCLCVCLFVCLFVCLLVYLFVCLFACVFACLRVCLIDQVMKPILSGRRLRVATLRGTSRCTLQQASSCGS